jgi:phosphate transport system protein
VERTVESNMQNPDRQRGLGRRLKTEMDSIGRDLDQAMHRVIEALEKRNGFSADRVSERLVDLLEREEDLNEICLEILGGKKGPTPELRWAGCAHRVLSLLFRVCEEITGIAAQIGKINEGPELPIRQELPEMGRMASEMLTGSIQAVLRPDAECARRVMEEDSCLDRRKEDFANSAVCLVNQTLNDSRAVVPYVLVSRHFERIGDHASHIAEEVAYYLGEEPA